MSDTDQSATGNDDLLDERWALLWATRISSRYHMRRQAFFERWARVTSATGVIFGSTAVTAALSAAHVPVWLLAITGGLVSVASVVDLVVGTAAMARKHDDLRKKFLSLESDISLHREPKEDDIKRWTSTRLTLETDEPPIYFALALLCENELGRATEGIGERIKLSLLKRLTAHWWRWENTGGQLI